MASKLKDLLEENDLFIMNGEYGLRKDIIKYEINSKLNEYGLPYTRSSSENGYSSLIDYVLIHEEMSDLIDSI